MYTTPAHTTAYPQDTLEVPASWLSTSNLNTHITGHCHVSWAGKFCYKNSVSSPQNSFRLEGETGKKRMLLVFPSTTVRSPVLSLCLEFWCTQWLRCRLARESPTRAVPRRPLGQRRAARPPHSHRAARRRVDLPGLEGSDRWIQFT